MADFASRNDKANPVFWFAAGDHVDELAPTPARAWNLSSRHFCMPIHPGPRVSNGGLRAVLEKDCSFIVSWALI